MQQFASYSLVTVVVAIAAPAAFIGAGIATSADVGLFQRALLGVLNGWLLVFACLTLVERRSAVPECVSVDYSTTLPAPTKRL